MKSNGRSASEVRFGGLTVPRTITGTWSKTRLIETGIRSSDHSDKFVVTLRLDDASFGRLNALRQRYFPPERNFIPAHLTFFHALTNEQRDNLESHLLQMTWSPTSLEFLPPVLIGRGVAIPVAGKELSERHALLIEHIGADALTRQDQQPLRPHVTVQNKVSPDIAKAALSEIQAGFTSWAGFGLGLDIWLYAGGPWVHRTFVPFG
jgi:2'-5' RNA ligase